MPDKSTAFTTVCMQCNKPFTDGIGINCPRCFKALSLPDIYGLMHDACPAISEHTQCVICEVCNGFRFEWRYRCLGRWVHYETTAVGAAAYQLKETMSIGKTAMDGQWFTRHDHMRMVDYSTSPPTLMTEDSKR